MSLRSPLRKASCGSVSGTGGQVALSRLEGWGERADIWVDGQNRWLDLLRNAISREARAN